MKSNDIIKKLNLKPLMIEGGYYFETYRSDGLIPASALPSDYNSGRVFSTAIYYLVTPDTFSRLHRLPSDEVFHFYLGDPVTMLFLYPDGRSETKTLGQDILNGQNLQVIAPKNTWQGCFLNDGGSYALMGTTVAPGFEFEDYEEADKNELLLKYPDKKDLINKLAGK